jgi:large subunit ribosomal protein L3
LTAQPSTSRTIPPSTSASQFYIQTRSLRSILKPPPKASPYNAGNQPSAHDKLAILARSAATTPYRTGLLARKAGMTAIFDAVTGERIPVTVLVIDRTEVLGHKTLDIHGYWAVMIGFGYRPEQRLTRAELGVFNSQGVAAKEKSGEFKVLGEDGLVPVGTELRADWFQEGQWVDVQGTTKGKGFQGVSTSP